MRNMEPVSEDSGSVEDVHDLRLMALLHELVRNKGNRGAAQALGIDPRKVASRKKDGKAVMAGEGSVGAWATVRGRLGCGPAA